MRKRSEYKSSRVVARLGNISTLLAPPFFVLPFSVACAHVCLAFANSCCYTPVCLPLLQCDCLSILREQPCKPADGPGLVWSWCPGGSLAADLKYVIRSNLPSVTQEATDAIGLSVIEFGAGLVRVPLCDTMQTFTNTSHRLKIN